jgi:hypothetical protein
MPGGGEMRPSLVFELRYPDAAFARRAAGRQNRWRCASAWIEEMSPMSENMRGGLLLDVVLLQRRAGRQSGNCTTRSNASRRGLSIVLRRSASVRSIVGMGPYRFLGVAKYT